MLRVLLLLLLCCASIAATGCAQRSGLDRPWDPKPGQSLHDQIPNWDDRAQRRCGGHLLESQRRPGMTDRC